MPLLSYPVLWTMLLLVPIIAVEAYVLRDQLHLRMWRALRVGAAANVLSTLAGFIVVILSAAVPLLREVMVTEGTVTDLLTLVLFVPFFYLSVWIERGFCRWRLREVGPATLRACVWRANAVSYTMLGVFIIARIVKNWIAYGKFLAPG